MTSSYRQVLLDTLTVGTTLTEPVYDPANPRLKLLGTPIEVTADVIAKLKTRGLDRVSMSVRDLAAQFAYQPQGLSKDIPSPHFYPTCDRESDLTQEIDSLADAQEGLTAELEGPPLLSKLSKPVDEPYDHDLKRKIVRRQQEDINHLDELFGKLHEGEAVDCEVMTSICQHAIENVLEDADLFACLGVNPYDSDYPMRHSLHVALVAIAIGVQLQLDDRLLRDLGVGCMVHDVGMLELGARFHKCKRALNRAELERLAEHPIYTMDAIAKKGARVSPLSRIVAFQIHERCDGSGYPRGRSGEEIHDLAKIAALADVYVGLVSDRAHRRAIQPYYAMEGLLREVSKGAFDPKAMRGLLHAISLFPIGSFVELTNGRFGRVVRANGERYDSPVVETWSEPQASDDAEIVDLNSNADVAIVRPATVNAMHQTPGRSASSRRESRRNAEP
jgi:HD-GYP domain-containing protein (c-di-GMP phosphodiesterase class II)